MSDSLDTGLLRAAQTMLQPHVNPNFLKNAFVPAGDPSGGGAGGPPPGAGGPPGAAGAPPGMDPSAGGPPPGGAPGGGAGGPDMGALQQMIQSTVQQALAAQGGGAGAGGAPGAGGAAGGLKPKIDVNVELMQIKNMMAKMMDAQGLHMPAQDMVATPDKLNAMAQGMPTTDPAAGGAGPTPGGPPSAPPTQKAAADMVAFANVVRDQVVEPMRKAAADSGHAFTCPGVDPKSGLFSFMSKQTGRKN